MSSEVLSIRGLPLCLSYQLFNYIYQVFPPETWLTINILDKHKGPFALYCIAGAVMWFHIKFETKLIRLDWDASRKSKKPIRLFPQKTHNFCMSKLLCYFLSIFLIVRLLYADICSSTEQILHNSIISYRGCPTI